MDNKKNVVNINRDIKVNPATIIIVCILVYVLISMLISARKNPITTYKVNKSSIDNNIMLEGIAIRDEQIIKATKSGYICYYIRDGEKVKKNSTVCTIDEKGQIINNLSETESIDKLLKADDYKDIRSLISHYKVSYKDVNFYSAYNFQTDINNKVLELSNEVLMQEVNKDSASPVLAGIKAPSSGLVTYYIDGFEDYNYSRISADAFDKSKYNKQTLKAGDIVTSNSPIVKIIPTEEWHIIAPVSDENIQALSEKTKIRFKINNSSYKVIMPFEIITGTDGKYIDIILDKYLSNFISERYLNVEILMEEESGLKIPISSLVEKQFYKVPVGFLSGGGNQSANNRLNVQQKDENGEITIKQVAPTVYELDDKYCLVDPNSLDIGDVLYNINNNKTLAVSTLQTETLTGVYSANRGTAEFKLVTIIKKIDEFALIESNERIKLYDNIILDSSKVTENQIIY